MEFVKTIITDLIVAMIWVIAVNSPVWRNVVTVLVTLILAESEIKDNLRHITAKLRFFLTQPIKSRHAVEFKGAFLRGVKLVAKQYKTLVAQCTCTGLDSYRQFRTI